jgi:hypothetical protein
MNEIGKAPNLEPGDPRPEQPGPHLPQPEEPTPQPPRPEMPPVGPEEPRLPPLDPDPLPIPVPGPTAPGWSVANMLQARWTAADARGVPACWYFEGSNEPDMYLCGQLETAR